MTESVLRSSVGIERRDRPSGLASIGKSTRRAFHVEIGNSLDRLPSAWAQLERTGFTTPFQTMAWLLPWYRIIGSALGATPVFVTVTDARNGAPLMFLPLCRRREGRLRVIEFADLGVSDYNAPLLAADFEPEERELGGILRRIFQALPSADLVRFNKAPEFVGKNRNPLIRHEMFHQMSFRSWGVELPATRAAFDGDVLGSTFRKELQRKHRRIGGRGKVEFETAGTEAQAREIFAALCEQRAARFAELGRHNILEDETFRSFYENVILTSSRDGFAVLSGLRVDGEIVAAMFALRRNGERHLLMSTLQSGKWKSCSPGNVAIDRAISEMIDGQESYLDFTIGDETYKRDFAATPRALYAGVRAQSLIGTAQAFTTNFKAIIRNRLRSVENA